MDATIPYEIPYPQCQPPLVQDGADIQHMQTMALGIDAAVQDLADDINDLWTSPDGAAMSFSGASTLLIGGTVPFDTSLFDNVGTLVNLPLNTFDLRQTGIYAVSCMVQGNSASGSQVWLGTKVVVNGVAGTTGGLSTWTSATTDSGSSSFHVRRFNAGDSISFQFDSAQNYDLLNSRAGIVRLV